MSPGEEAEVCNLVARSFNEFIAPDFPDEGVEEFFRYSNPRALIKRSEGSHFVLLAQTEGSIAGMIEMREMRHVSMLFVDKAFHRRGIARELLRAAIDKIKSGSRPAQKGDRAFLTLRPALLREPGLRPDGRRKNHTRRYTHTDGARSPGR